MIIFGRIFQAFWDEFIIFFKYIQNSNYLKFNYRNLISYVIKHVFNNKDYLDFGLCMWTLFMWYYIFFSLQYEFDYETQENTHYMLLYYYRTWTILLWNRSSFILMKSFFFYPLFFSLCKSVDSIILSLPCFLGLILTTW